MAIAKSNSYDVQEKEYASSTHALAAHLLGASAQERARVLATLCGPTAARVLKEENALKHENALRARAKMRRDENALRARRGY